MIKGGSLGSAANAPALLTRQRVPLIKMPTFTGGAAGAITLGTAIDYAWPECFGYFGAGVLATGSAAGFYYCEMSSTTEGVVYNNRYTPAVGATPAVPASPTAFPDAIIGGAGAVGAFDAILTAFPAGILGDAGVITTEGLGTGSATAGVSIGFSPTPAPLSVATGLTLRVLGLYAVRGLQKVIYETLPTAVVMDVDLSADQTFYCHLTADAATDWVTLTNYSLLVDNR